MLAFLSVMTSVMASLHYYFWVRLVRDTQLPAPWRGIATALIILFGISLPTVMLLLRTRPSPLLRTLVLPAYVWMGVVILLLFSLLAADAARLLAWLFTAVARTPLDPERRLLFRRALGAGAATLAGVLSLRALQEGLAPVKVKHVEVPLARLPRALDGTTIAQLSDVHIGAPTIGLAWITELVKKTNAVGADIIAITGDLVDGSVEHLRAAVAPLAGLRARHGVYFVTGNHEYYSGAVAWEAELTRLGVRVLRNERVRIERDGAGFDLAGVDDHSARGMAPGHGPDLAAAVAGRDERDELVLLAHQPRQVHEAVDHGVGLQLSGHTHGGQIWPWGFMVRLQQGFLAGLTRVGDTMLYTSRGTGYWGPPMRLGADAEITRITLRSTRAS